MSDTTPTDRAPLIALGRGIYTVPETCRILGRGMTPRKIHYWLKTGLLGIPIRRGHRGTPVLLSFEQVLRIKTLQRIRDELRFSLLRARRALAWIVDNLVASDEEWQYLHFFRSSGNRMAVALADGSGLIDIGTAQSILPIDEDLAAVLTAFLLEAREQWQAKTLPIEGFTKLHSRALVMAGAPVIAGTRIETEFVGNLAQELSVDQIHRELFPDVDLEAIRQATEFEGILPAAA